MDSKFQLYSFKNGKRVSVKAIYHGEYLPFELKGTPGRILASIIKYPNQLLPISVVVDEAWEGSRNFCSNNRKLLDVHLIRVREFLDCCEFGYEILRFGKYIYFKTEESELKPLIPFGTEESVECI
jgi:hypothetical protein